MRVDVTREQLAERIAEVVANSVDNPYNVTRFTPSIKIGRRYVGIEIDGKPFLVTIEVSEG